MTSVKSGFSAASGKQKFCLPPRSVAASLGGDLRGGVDVLHHEFMAEPWAPINHRTNIMDPNFRRAGVGAVQGPDAVYVTVVFCR